MNIMPFTFSKNGEFNKKYKRDQVTINLTNFEFILPPSLKVETVAWAMMQDLSIAEDYTP